jgi:hypothetical protein
MPDNSVVQQLVDTEIQASLRQGVLDQLGATLDRVCVSGSGEIVLLHGAPRIGRSTLLAQWVAELGGLRGTPRVIAGGFRSGTARGDLSAWLIPRPPRALRTAGVRAAGLADWISAAAAGGAVFDPTGVWNAAISIAAFVGQTATATTSTATSAVRFEPVRAEALTHAIDRLSRDGTPLVLVLDDFDLAEPSVEWSTVFLRRRLAGLAHARPVLAVIAASTDSLSARTVAPTEFSTAIEELRNGAVTGLAALSQIELRPLTSSQIEAWLGEVSADVMDSLLACGGGHPGWTVTLFRDWRSDRIVGLHEGVWSFTRGRLSSAALTATEYVTTSLWNALAPDVAAFDRAKRALTLASLEGGSFSLAVLADVLGEDPETLGQWLDERLCAPTGNGGFIERITGQDCPSGETLYRFTSPLIPAAFLAGTTVADDDVRRYAKALITQYRRPSWALGLAAMLFLRVGDTERAAHFRRQADLSADSETLTELLAEEMNAFDNGDTEHWEPWRQLVAAGRISYAAAALRSEYDPSTVAHCLLSAYGLVARVRHAAPQLSGDLIQVDAMWMLSIIAAEASWMADEIACARRSLELAVAVDDDNSVIRAATAGAHAYLRLSSAIEGGDERWIAHVTRRQFPVDILGAPELSANSSVPPTPAELRDAARRLAQSASAARDRLGRLADGHPAGEIEGLLALLAGFDGATRLREAHLNAAIRQFSKCEAGDRCQRAAVVRDSLAELLDMREALPEAQAVAVAALRGHLAWGRWENATRCQHQAAHRLLKMGKGDEALMAFSSAIFLARQVRASLPLHEGPVWRCLGDAAIGLGFVEAGRICLAMAVHIGDLAMESGNEQSPFAIEAIEKLGGDRPLSLRQARAAWEFDQGESFLRLRFGAGWDAVAMYLADLVGAA